jgi:hypothetical protein
MPTRGDHAALHFDPKQPRELRRYFADLDFLFKRSHISNDQERKGHACYYLDFTTAELWESLLEFSNRDKLFADFALAIYKLYPGSESDRKWSIADLEKLVEERSRIGVHSLGDLGDYYRQFISIATFLHSHNRIAEGEETRAFA